MAGLRGTARRARRVRTGLVLDLTGWAPDTCAGCVSPVLAVACCASPRRGSGCPSLTGGVLAGAACRSSITPVGDGPLPRLPGNPGGEAVRERAPADRDCGTFVPGHDSRG